jgi:hypothetical protein
VVSLGLTINFGFGFAAAVDVDDAAEVDAKPPAADAVLSEDDADGLAAAAVATSRPSLREQSLKTTIFI